MTEVAIPNHAGEAPKRLSLEDRQAILDGAVMENTRQGWRVLSRTENQVQLVKGKPTNHLLHLILSCVTFGIWIPMWIGVAVFAGEKQKFVTVDQFGTVQG